MYDYLLDHALKNVWCTPDQDLQAVVKPARLTSPNGVFGKVEVLWRTHKLPNTTSRFHVYQIGQLHPALMGLLDVSLVWTTLAAACAKESLIADVYNTAGVQLLRNEVWYMVTPDRNLILAVKENAKIPVNIRTEDIFLRVYSNAFFNSMRADAATDVVEVVGGTVRDTNEIMALQTKYNTAKTKAGRTYAFVNGYLRESINLLTVAPGDAVEFVRDASIYNVVEFTVSDLETFVSTLDTKRKYLLHYPGQGDMMIDYQDDIDVFVIQPDAVVNKSKGVFYHRNTIDAVRQVTHKDYAIPVPYVVGYAAANNWANPEVLKIRLHLRKSGYNRPLVNENNRIKELYKLNDADLRQAMLGVDSVVENWRADVLENAAYTQIMRSAANAVTKPLVENAYGYNAMSVLLGNTPSFTREYSGQRIIDVPYGLQFRATGYEYDVNGLLLGWFPHTNASVYPARDVRAKLVELISGQSDTRLDEVYGNTTVTLDPLANYRMYVCPKVGGLPNNIWEDVTDSGQYVIAGNTLTWLINTAEHYPLVRSDKTILAYSLEMQPTDGLLRFSLTHRALRNGVVGNYVMQIPMGELDLFLNGKSLIEHVDYIVNFPQIVIYNKEYLINPSTDEQKIDVRFAGFCNADLTRDVPEDIGYVKYGKLSHNNKFDIRDDKVMRIVVDGQLFDRSELVFTEDSPAINILDERNGAPYQIRDIVVPLRGLATTNTYTARVASEVIDARVSDYMTLKLPEPVTTQPNVIPARYQIFSPMCCKILYDLRSGILQDDRLIEHYNDMDVREICAPYEYLLQYDPTQIDLELSNNYVVVHPHNLFTVIDLDIYHYKFLQRVVKLYLRDKVSLSHFIRIAT